MSIKGLAAVGIVAGMVAGVGGLAAQVPTDGTDKAKEPVKFGAVDPPKTTEAPRIDATPQPDGLAELLASDRRRLEGKWSVVKVSQNGREVEESRFILAPVQITRDQIQVHFLGNTVFYYEYRIDPRAKPRAMRVAKTSNMMRGEAVVPAWWLYSFDGETLKIALDEDAQRHRRPKDFNDVDAEHPITVLELVRDADSPVPASANPPVTSPTPKAPASDDLAKLQGTWTVLAMERNGVAALPTPEIQFVIAGNAWIGRELKNPERPPAVMTFTLDPSREPKTFDLVQTGVEKPHVTPGIYRIDGPILVFCIDEAGVKRPTEFDTKPGSNHRLQVLRRERPRPPAPDGPVPATPKEER